ncbi:MAG: zinc-ribbon domain-containing protein [Anaeromyxobacter sp.]|nr:zinc-ribbon domain-containing protein [Anaeromyxobacter sp.]
MKFTCDSCGSAYMIPDDKVGPAGVKVRCKKCGNVVTVRRAEAPPVVAPPPVAPPPEVEGSPGPGLDDELGAAFDHAFGDPAPAPAPQPPAAEPAPAPAPPVTAATEWFVGIGDAQVGPLPVAEVKRRWEAGELGPDSLVWRAGMADWAPLTGVPELAAAVSPLPQPEPERLPTLPPVVAPVVAAAPVAPRVASAAHQPARALTPPAGVPAAPAPEVEWKPAGASALASLASEELAARDAATAPAAPRPSPGRSLVDELPDTGGVDPTGLLPLPIKGMEVTDERAVRRTSVARGAEAMRQQRSGRTALLAGVGLAVVVAGAGATWWFTAGGGAPQPPPAPPPAPPAVVQVQPPAPPIPAPSPVEPAPAGGQAAAGAAAPAPEAGAPAAAPALAAAPPAAAPEPVARAAAAPKAAPRPVRPPPAKAPAPRVAARAEAPPAQPATKPAAKKKDSVLDFDQGAEDDLAAALGGSGRTVYVPPKTGGAAVPERLSDAQITESVRLHVDALRRCAAEQQAREPGVKGTLKMAWTIQPDGVPKEVRCLTPDLAQSPFAGCITGVVRGIRFPRIGDARGQPVTFPFGF